MYSKEFKELVEKGVKENFYIGTGKPNARILVVGKEAAIGGSEGLEIQNRKNYLNNAVDWKRNIDEDITEATENWNYHEYLNDENATNNPIFAFKGAQIKEQGKTWRKYQKLHDHIFGSSSFIGRYGHDFQRNFFITEMSDNPFKTTSEAKKVTHFKDMLDHRRTTFFKSNFVQKFPVVVLACWDYIVNNENERQIDDTFDVKYVKHYLTKSTKNPQAFYIHFN
ncbi:MAG TPA: hypothetical protein VKA27_18710, partial [Sunxiuqinia sp.]|nr:hypothetical protein [Sunxiuqinia sp.]